MKITLGACPPAGHHGPVQAGGTDDAVGDHSYLPYAHLNHYERAHWTVENRLHWVRDVTFREDHSQVRTGAAPRVLASFRNLVISTMRLADRANTAHARRDLLDHNAAFTVYNI
ncbi:hypothetical protein [Nonomuraea sp. NEAU-A123]|uniref:hypothetical protein n=1 Tax=Nonomuraea sp. NEAU-A123 TaxID=2839649 RepID=UPI001BE3D707|nr:hypothetical protein [Nonomuraea sp. NEAU-A123]MBT2230520.1 hypothetical protein [Nonomuraea sp. NEAU-A123]